MSVERRFWPEDNFGEKKKIWVKREFGSVENFGQKKI